MKYLISILFAIMTITASALDFEDFRTYVYPLDLTAGVQLPSYLPVWDFKNPYHWSNWMPVAPRVYIPWDHMEHEQFSSWYKTDFTEDPFDGVIEVLVVGEPLPSASTTLILTLSVIAILLCCRETKWKRLNNP